MQVPLQGAPQAIAQVVPVQQVQVQTVNRNGRAPPAGAAEGGHWETVNTCGIGTWLIGIFVLPCIVFYPIDSRIDYVQPDGLRCEGVWQEREVPPQCFLSPFSLS